MNAFKDTLKKIFLAWLKRVWEMLLNLIAWLKNVLGRN